MEFSYWLRGERSALLPKEGAVLPVNRRLGGAPSQCEHFGEEITCLAYAGKQTMIDQTPSLSQVTRLTLLSQL